MSILFSAATSAKLYVELFLGVLGLLALGAGFFMVRSLLEQRKYTSSALPTLESGVEEKPKKKEKEEKSAFLLENDGVKPPEKAVKKSMFARKSKDVVIEDEEEDEEGLDLALPTIDPGSLPVPSPRASAPVRSQSDMPRFSSTPAQAIPAVSPPPPVQQEEPLSGVADKLLAEVSANRGARPIDYSVELPPAAPPVRPVAPVRAPISEEVPLPTPSSSFSEEGKASLRSIRNAIGRSSTPPAPAPVIDVEEPSKGSMASLDGEEKSSNKASGYVPRRLRS